MTKVHGHKVGPITYKEPGNGLPKWVREVAAERGYADSREEALSLIVTEEDINEAFDCAAHGDGAGCVMAQAGKRVGAKYIYFYRTTAWVDFHTGPIVRYITTKTMLDNIIKPYDKKDRDNIIPGHYPIKPPTKSRSLKERREYEKTKKKNPSANREKKPVHHTHTDRVVMAAQT